MYARTAWSVLQEGTLLHHHPLPSLSPSDQPEDSEQLSGFNSTIANFTSNGGLAWRAWGPSLEVLDPTSGVRKAAWTFGALLQNSGTKVTCVCEVGVGTTSHMMVGLDLGPDKGSCGMACLLSLQSSKITRAIYLPYKVISICMVTGGMYAVDVGTLAPELRSMRGIVAVGMAQGRVSLIDLVLDANGDVFLSDEVSPGCLTTQPLPDPHPEARRREAVSRKTHLELCLSDGMSSNGNFSLVGPDEHILFETTAHKVTVTALLYVPQIASLVVGYNFGAFQVYNLSKLAIECASPFEKNMPPIQAFAYQEPENDPRNFVYLWLSRSWRMLDGNVSPAKKSMPALCTLYAMNYDKKEWIEGHGLWYQGLLSISPRFEFEALGGLGLEGRPTAPSVVFTTSSVIQSTLTTGLPTTLTAPDEETSPVPELSLCVFGWTGGVLEKGSIAVKNYFAVFDINQWYQAQMPFSLGLERDQLCPYMSLHTLDCNLVQSQGEIILAAAPKASTWARHKSTMHNDKDWYPSSLSYDLRVITSSSILKFHCSSAQSSVLSCLVQGGPVTVVSPSQGYKLCVLAGLIPNDNGSPTTAKSLIQEREMILRIALDHQLVCLLVNCVEEFAEGRFTHLGCSLSTLLDWAWLQVYNLKDSNDSLCGPLFDVDVGMVSEESICSLHQNLTMLSTLLSVITAIRNNTQAVTSRSADELDGKVMVVTLLHLHLQVVLWFYHCRLLPQREEENMLDDSDVPYPVSLLQKIYANRRAEIKGLSSSLEGTEILLIDGLLEDTHESVGKLWSREGGSTQYPPPSLHALLAMYLLPDVPTTTKHRIVQYLFLDLASLLSDGFVNVVEELVKFPSSFSLSPSLIKLSQAFWLIDHKDFQEGLNVLLDPLISSEDIAIWQHRRIIKALLYQGEHSRALTYARIRRPPLTDLDDIRLHLTLLLANGLTREAFHYQRTHRVQENTDDLLNHFFTGCEEMGKLQTVIQLPLNKLEEDSLISYLHTSTKPSALDLLIVYYLQRSRYVEVLELQNQLRSFGHIGTSRKRHGARTALVDGFLAQLPDESKKMAAGLRRNTHVYIKPQPLSAHIRQLKHERITLSSQKHLGQSSSPKKQDLSAPFTPFRNKAQRRKYACLESEPDTVMDFSNQSGRGTKRDISHIIFPKQLEFSSSDSPQHEEVPVTPTSKRRKVWDSFVGHDTLRLAESLHEKCHRLSTLYMEDSYQEYNRSRCHNVSAEVLSLLQTPLVQKKPFSSQAGQTTDASLADTTTPQSILKVRKMLQRSRSPSVASESSVTSFPTLRKHSNITEQNVTADVAMTPKQLRFHLPIKEVGVKEVDVPEHGTEREEEEEEEEEQEDVEEVVEEEEEEEKEEKEEILAEVSTTESEPEVEVPAGSEEDLPTKTQEAVLKRISRSPSPEDLTSEGVAVPRQPLPGYLAKIRALRAHLMGEEDKVEETKVEGRAEMEGKVEESAYLTGEEDNAKADVEGREDAEEGESEESEEERSESEPDEEASEKSIPLEEEVPSQEVSLLASANSSYQEMYYSFTEEETVTVTKKRTDIVEICLDSDDDSNGGEEKAVELKGKGLSDHESVDDNEKLEEDQKEVEQELKVQEEISETSESVTGKEYESNLEKKDKEEEKYDLQDVRETENIILGQDSVSTVEAKALDVFSHNVKEIVVGGDDEEETSSTSVLPNHSDKGEAPGESESVLPSECVSNDSESRNIVEIEDDMITAAIEMAESAELPSTKDAAAEKGSFEYSECFDPLVFSDEELENSQEEAAETEEEKVEKDLLDVALKISESLEKANNDDDVIMEVESLADHAAASEQKLNKTNSEQFEDLIFSDSEESSREGSMVIKHESKDHDRGEVELGSKSDLIQDTKDEKRKGEQEESLEKKGMVANVNLLQEDVKDDSECMEPLVFSDDEHDSKDGPGMEKVLESQSQDASDKKLHVSLEDDSAVVDDEHDSKDGPGKEKVLESQNQDVSDQKLHVSLEDDSSVVDGTPTLINTGLEIQEAERIYSADITGVSSDDALAEKVSNTHLLEKSSVEVSDMETEENVNHKEDEMKGRENVDHKEGSAAEEESTLSVAENILKEDNMGRKDIVTKVRHDSSENFEDKQSTDPLIVSVCLKEVMVETMDSVDSTAQNVSGRDGASAETKASLEKKNVDAKLGTDLLDEEDIVLPSGLGDIEDMHVPTDEERFFTTEEEVVESMGSKVAEEKPSIEKVVPHKATTLQDEVVSPSEMEKAGGKLIKTGESSEAIEKGTSLKGVDAEVKAITSYHFEEKTASVEDDIGKPVEDKSSELELQSPRKGSDKAMKSVEVHELDTVKVSEKLISISTESFDIKGDNSKALVKATSIPSGKVDEEVEMELEIDNDKKSSDKGVLDGNSAQVGRKDASESYKSVEISTHSLEDSTIVSEEVRKDGSKMDIEKGNENKEKGEEIKVVSPVEKSKQSSGFSVAGEVTSPAKPTSKEPESPGEKQRKAAVIESEKIIESGRSRRRSSRLSSFSETMTPQTPRRGRISKSAENVRTPVTPTRRSRRLSGLGVQTEQQKSGKKTPETQTKVSSTKKTPARGTPAKSPSRTDHLDVSHVTLQLEPILETVAEKTEESNTFTPQPKEKGGRRRHSSGSTSGAEQTPQKSITPRLSTRRRTRLSTASETLETITEDTVFGTKDIKEITKVERTHSSSRPRGRPKKVVSSPESKETKAEEASNRTPGRRKLALPTSGKESRGSADDATQTQLSTEKSNERSSSLSSGISEVTPPKQSTIRAAVSPHTSAKDTDSEEELRKEVEAAASRKARTRRQSRRLSNLLANPHASTDALDQVISTRTRRSSLALKVYQSSDEGEISGPSKRSSHSMVPTDPSTVVVMTSRRRSMRQNIEAQEQSVSDTLTEDFEEIMNEEASESPETKLRLLEVVAKKKGNLMAKILSRDQGRKIGKPRRLEALRIYSAGTDDEDHKMESDEAKDSKTHSKTQKTDGSEDLDDTLFPFEFSDPESVLKEGKAISSIFEKLNTEAGAISEATEFVFSPPELARKSSRAGRRSSRTVQEDKSEITTVMAKSLRKRRGR